MEIQQVQQMKRVGVVIIATPSIGNLVPAVEFATHLINHHSNRISVTILDISMPQWPLIQDYIQSHNSYEHIRIIKLSPPNSQPIHQHNSVIEFTSLHIENHKHIVKETLKNIPLVGIFIDMFCTSMIDVANELSIPCYMFFASPLAYLSFVLHLTTLVEEPDSVTELKVPGFTNLVPPKAFPSYCIDKNNLGYSWFILHALRYKETKGIVVNTFQELEPYPLDSLSSSTNIPPVYPVGPIIDHAGPAKWHGNRAAHEKIIQWLDHQPESSVVFLCFGSMGSMNRVQVREIATGLEKSGYRFLWTIREPPKGKLEFPSDYHDFGDNLFPNGFIDRTAERGLVCGWVSQVSVLAHKAVGGFVSHCGWNSILESIWYGVPIATWPLYGEQNLNAFEMVKEVGLSMEIRWDDKESDILLAHDIERAVRELKDGCDGDLIREKVKEISEKSKKALMKDGSSYQALDDLVNGILSNA